MQQESKLIRNKQIQKMEANKKGREIMDSLVKWLRENKNNAEELIERLRNDFPWYFDK